MKKLEIYIALAVLAVAIALTAVAAIGTVSVTTTPTLVLAARQERRWAVLSNFSTNDMWVKVDSSTNALTVTNGIKIVANGGTLSLAASGANPAKNNIYAISGTGTNILSYQEGDER